MQTNTNSGKIDEQKLNDFMQKANWRHFKYSKCSAGYYWK